MNYSRRDLSFLLPAFLAADAAKAEDKALSSKSYAFDQLPLKTNPKTHNETRQVFTGETHNGYPIDLHITALAPGQMPHPQHHHVHEEMVFLQSGTLEVYISGQTSRIGPGGVAYVHSNDEHGWKNVGETPAQYFVFAIGKQD